MMITVNLRPGQKRKAAGGAGGRKLADQFSAIVAKVKDPYLVGSVLFCAAVGGALGFSLVWTNSRFYALGPRLEQAREDHKRYELLLKQKKRTEQIRDSLLAQIVTIRRVDADRYIWPHVLDEVAKAVPPYTWLTTLQPLIATRAGTQPAMAADTTDTTAKPIRFRLEGRTMDLQAYTRFLRQLEASPWIMDVVPFEAKTIIEKERPVNAFTILATFQRADSAYIRTVPLSQSAR